MEGYHIDKARLKQRMTELIKLELVPDLKSATEVQIFNVLATALKEQFIDAWNGTREKCQEQDLKRVYYLSMEFLMGRALGNNLINLGAVKEVREILSTSTALRTRNVTGRSATAASADWLPASWIPWPLSATRPTAAASATNTACSARSSRTAIRRKSRTTG